MKIRGLLIVLMLGLVVVYFIYFGRSVNGKGALQTEIDQYGKMKVTLTGANMDSLARVILAYAAGAEGLPENLKQLERSHPLGSGLYDAWGKEIQYERLSDSGFRLRSSGPDGVMGTADDIEKDY
jgi:hypothetical protein